MMQKRILTFAAVVLLALIGWKTERLYAQAHQPAPPATATNAPVKVDVNRAMRQAKALMDWLNAHPSERRMKDPKPPKELLTLPEQQLVAWSEKRKNASFNVLCPGLGTGKTNILFMSETFVHNNPKNKDGLSDAIPGAGFYIVAYSDGPFKGQIKQIPVAETRVEGCGDFAYAFCPVFPGDTKYREDLPKDLSIDPSRANLLKIKAEIGRAGWALPSKAARVSWYLGYDHPLKFGPRFQDMYPKGHKYEDTNSAKQHP